MYIYCRIVPVQITEKQFLRDNILKIMQTCHTLVNLSAFKILFVKIPFVVPTAGALRS
jgi:uncharacterized protein (DUF486 family)